MDHQSLIFLDLWALEMNDPTSEVFKGFFIWGGGGHSLLWESIVYPCGCYATIHGLIWSQNMYFSFFLVDWYQLLGPDISTA